MPLAESTMPLPSSLPLYLTQTWPDAAIAVISRVRALAGVRSPAGPVMVQSDCGVPEVAVVQEIV
jgi:hypothetical protein